MVTKTSMIIALSAWIVGNSWKLIDRKSECGIQCLIVGDQIYHEPWWISSGNCWAQVTLHGQFTMLFNMLVIKKAELFTENELIFLHYNLISPWNLVVKLVVKLHHQTTGSYFIHKTLLLKTGYPACKYPEVSHLISMVLIHKNSSIMFIHLNNVEQRNDRIMYYQKVGYAIIIINNVYLQYHCIIEDCFIPPTVGLESFVQS